MNIIYLDNSATTRISDVALDKYNEISRECFGNPSSLHTLGVLSEKRLDEVRREVLRSLGEKSGEVIFTSSGTEANNLAIIGRAYAKERYKRGAKIISTRGEHASVSEPLRKLSGEGFKIAEISTRGGTIDLEEFKKELTPDVILVTVMLVNNETGALYDIKKISTLMRAYAPEAILHIDATQAYMKMPISVKTLGCDMITLSSHKIHGPKGVGALYVSPAVIKNKGISAVTLGGGQEGGLRSGTENVPSICAFGEAIKDGVLHLKEREEYLLTLREYLVEKIKNELPEISLTLPEYHAPHILNITLPNIKSETMLHFLSGEGIFVSSGSACSSNTSHISSALTAYGRSEKEADCSIRISLSYENTKEEIDTLCSALKGALARLSRMR